MSNISLFQLKKITTNTEKYFKQNTICVQSFVGTIQYLKVGVYKNIYESGIFFTLFKILKKKKYL